VEDIAAGRRKLLSDEPHCPVCQRKPVVLTKVKDRSGLFDVECQVCGDYRITASASSLLDGPHRREWYLVCGVLRRASDAQNEIQVTSENLEDLIRSGARPPTPLELMDRVILDLADRVQAFGVPVTMRPLEFPRYFLKGEPELDYALANLRSVGLIERHTAQSQKGEVDWNISVTLNGFRRANELRAKRPISSQCFVAMWFAPEMDSAWEDAFSPALVETGYHPMRVDRAQHNGKIDDFIVAEIRRSGLLVADFTGHRGGVYFETGFALGLGIPVIWTCREDDIDGAHFDTRQYNHLVWSTPLDLRTKLVNRIRATAPLVPSAT
jgi:hypothetical protein